MRLPVLRSAMQRIRTHAVRFHLAGVTIAFSSGVFRAGTEWFEQARDVLREELAGAIPFDIEIRMRSRELIDPDWACLLRRSGVAVHLEVEPGSHVGDVAQVIEDCAVTSASMPIGESKAALDVYRAVCRAGLSQFTFLLPASRPGRYADDLIPLFEQWWSDGDSRTRVEPFDSLLRLLSGSCDTAVAEFGEDPTRTVVIEPDGRVGMVDSARFVSPAFWDLYSDIGNEPLRILTGAQEKLPAACRACALHEVCGGGPLLSRYREGSWFDQPSVHCEDLWKLISHMVTACLQADAVCAGD